MPFIYFNLLDSGSVFLVMLRLYWVIFSRAYGNVGVQMAYFRAIRKARYRYAGVTVAREISSLIGGGIAPMICSFLLLAYGTWLPIAIYIGFTMLCSFWRHYLCRKP